MSHSFPAPHPLQVCLDAVEAAFDGAAMVSPDSLEDEALTALSPRSQRVVARAQEFAMRIAGSLDKRDLAKKYGATSTGAMIADSFGGSRAEADKMVRVAQTLETQAPTTRQAMASGQLSLAQADIIAKTMANLTTDVTPLQRDAAETTLIADAKTLTLKDLRRRADRIADTFAPEEVDQIEGDILQAREKAARTKTELWMIDQRDGTYRGGFIIPEMAADMLKTALDAICAPRSQALDYGADIDDGTSAHARLSYKSKQGLALCELIEHIPSDQLPQSGGVGANLTINFDYDQLVSGIGAATLSTGTRISIHEARRLACEAKLIPMVFDSKPVPLDLGRDARVFNKYQRAALAIRDRGCTFPGCDRPPNWGYLPARSARGSAKAITPATAGPMAEPPISKTASSSATSTTTSSTTTAGESDSPKTEHPNTYRQRRSTPNKGRDETPAGTSNANENEQPETSGENSVCFGVEE